MRKLVFVGMLISVFFLTSPALASRPEEGTSAEPFRTKTEEMIRFIESSTQLEDLALLRACIIERALVIRSGAGSSGNICLPSPLKVTQSSLEDLERLKEIIEARLEFLAEEQGVIGIHVIEKGDLVEVKITYK